MLLGGRCQSSSSPTCTPQCNTIDPPCRRPPRHFYVGVQVCMHVGVSSARVCVCVCVCVCARVSARASAMWRHHLPARARAACARAHACVRERMRWQHLLAQPAAEEARGDGNSDFLLITQPCCAHVQVELSGLELLLQMIWIRRCRHHCTHTAKAATAPLHSAQLHSHCNSNNGTTTPSTAAPVLHSYCSAPLHSYCTSNSTSKRKVRGRLIVRDRHHYNQTALSQQPHSYCPPSAS